MEAEHIVLVTGATDGIGRETALALARQGCHVIIHGRSKSRAESARLWIEQHAQTSHVKVDAVAGDLAVLREVRALASEMTARYGHLDVLVNNAGIYANEPMLTIDGWESTFGVNHIAPFVLTHGLMRLLEAAPAPRVINVSSVAHSRGRLEPTTFRSLDRFEPYHAYAQSKLANILFTMELQRRRPHFAVNALHPGVISTKLLTEGFGVQGPDSVAEGAATSVWLASSPAAAKLHGTYCVRSHPTTPSTLARDPELARTLWAHSESALG
jgi:NAD(P)-dependent dehydrogenase (short-subunit alcohol dehydrogenase family)